MKNICEAQKYFYFYEKYHRIDVHFGNIINLNIQEVRFQQAIFRNRCIQELFLTLILVRTQDLVLFKKKYLLIENFRYRKLLSQSICDVEVSCNYVLMHEPNIKCHIGSFYLFSGFEKLMRWWYSPTPVHTYWAL